MIQISVYPVAVNIGFWKVTPAKYDKGILVEPRRKEFIVSAQATLHGFGQVGGDNEISILALVEYSNGMFDTIDATCVQRIVGHCEVTPPDCADVPF